MPTTGVIDLDVLAPEPKRVRLAGKEYDLPGDIPVSDMLQFEALSQKAEREGDDFDEAQGARELYQRLLGLFRMHQPDLEEIPLQADQMLGFIPAVYGEGEPERETDAEGKPPDPEPAAGTPSGSGKGKPRAPKKKAPSAS